MACRSRLSQARRRLGGRKLAECYNPAECSRPRAPRSQIAPAIYVVQVNPKNARKVYLVPWVTWRLPFFGHISAALEDTCAGPSATADFVRLSLERSSWTALHPALRPDRYFDRAPASAQEPHTFSCRSSLRCTIRPQPSLCTRALRTANEETQHASGGALFRTVSRHGKVNSNALSRKSVSKILKAASIRTGFDPRKISPRGLLTGICTAPRLAGQPVIAPMLVIRVAA